MTAAVDPDTLSFIGAGLGLLSVLVALGVPGYVEWSRRPRLRVELGQDANSPDPLWRIVHVRVINEPLNGWQGKVLLRNPAAGCEVTMVFESQSDTTQLVARGKWSARPEPLATIPVQPGTYAQAFSPEMIPQSLTLGVSPSREGQPVARIKHNGDAEAFAYDPEVYAHGNLRNNALALPHEEYKVTVTARAGGISSAPRIFSLKNGGTSYRDLRLDLIE